MGMHSSIWLAGSLETLATSLWPLEARRGIASKKSCLSVPNRLEKDKNKTAV
jgi:hypothetical protein